LYGWGRFSWHHYGYHLTRNREQNWKEGNRIFSDVLIDQIYELFDMICGTSTGGILAVATGILRKNSEECCQLYKDLATRVFSPLSTVQRVLGGTLYSSQLLEGILLKECGSQRLQSDPNTPRVRIFSVILILNITFLTKFITIFSIICSTKAFFIHIISQRKICHHNFF